jgi:hypothetical protein
MPNGGLDNCATCSFATAADAKASSTGDDARLAVLCTIRELLVPHPWHTYCANHPKHNHDLVAVPVGPVYVPDTDEAQARRLWMQSPDDEGVRQGLVAALEALPERPRREYIAQPWFEPTLVLQLGLLGERRALPGLRRILTFDLDARPADGALTYVRRAVLVALALESLGQIAGDEVFDDVEPWLTFGRDLAAQEGVPEEQVRVAERVRLAAVRALGRCGLDRALRLLEDALDDPATKVATLAAETLARDS